MLRWARPAAEASVVDEFKRRVNGVKVIDKRHPSGRLHGPPMQERSQAARRFVGAAGAVFKKGRLLFRSFVHLQVHKQGWLPPAESLVM